MTPLTPEEIATLVELERAGSVAPWEHDEEDATIEVAGGGAVCHVAHHGNTHTILKRHEEWSHADARLIAAARNALPRLLAEREEMRREALKTLEGAACFYCEECSYMTIDEAGTHHVDPDTGERLPCVEGVVKAALAEEGKKR